MAKRQRDQRQRSETLATLLMPVYEEKLEETLGNRLRELRRQQGLSLRALAEKSGLSANTLSLIENGKTSPSVATLQQIALALNIPITAFFETKAVKDPVLHTQKSTRANFTTPQGVIEEVGKNLADQFTPGQNVAIQPAMGEEVGRGIGNEGLQPFIVTLHPQASSGTQPLTHEGSEFVYCLSGKVIYNVIGEEYVLEAGDTLLFSSKLPHAWKNALDEPSQLIVTLATTDESRRPVHIEFPV